MFELSVTGGGGVHRLYWELITSEFICSNLKCYFVGWETRGIIRIYSHLVTVSKLFNK